MAFENTYLGRKYDFIKNYFINNVLGTIKDGLKYDPEALKEMYFNRTGLVPVSENEVFNSSSIDSVVNDD